MKKIRGLSRSIFAVSVDLRESFDSNFCLCFEHVLCSLRWLEMERLLMVTRRSPQSPAQAQERGQSPFCLMGELYFWCLAALLVLYPSDASCLDTCIQQIYTQGPHSKLTLCCRMIMWCNLIVTQNDITLNYLGDGIELIEIRKIN